MEHLAAAIKTARRSRARGVAGQFVRRFVIGGGLRRIERTGYCGRPCHVLRFGRSAKQGDLAVCGRRLHDTAGRPDWSGERGQEAARAGQGSAVTKL